MPQSLWWSFCKWSRVQLSAHGASRPLSVPWLASDASDRLKKREFLISEDYVADRNEETGKGRRRSFAYSDSDSYLAALAASRVFSKVYLPLDANTFASIDHFFFAVCLTSVLSFSAYARVVIVFRRENIFYKNRSRFSRHLASFAINHVWSNRFSLTMPSLLFSLREPLAPSQR